MANSRFLTTAACLTLVSATLISTDGFARGGEDGRHDERKTLLERLDGNADGVLSQAEFSDHKTESTIRHFNKKDGDSDGLLSLEEFAASGKHRRHQKLEELDSGALALCAEQSLGYEFPERPDPETAFVETDLSSDGSVDLDEFLTAGDLRAEERFASIDSDGDAQLSNDEIEAYQAIQKEQRDARRSCVTEQLDEDRLLN